MFFEKVYLDEILKDCQTPIYVYSKETILHNCNEYHKAFAENSLKNYKIHFAMKANNNLSILRLLRQQNFGIDAVSVGEIEKAKFAGFDYEDVIFSGVGKTEDDLLFSVKNGIGQINVESIEEIEMLAKIASEVKKQTNIAIRINPNIEAHTNQKISTGSNKNKFGIDINELENAISITKKSFFLSLKGLSIHIGSQIMNLNDFEKAFAIVEEIYKKHSEFEVLDLGGGLGINYNDSKEEKRVSKYDYVALIAKYFGDFDGKIIIEPGRSIIADAGVFLTKIVRVKHTATKNFIIVDGGMNNLLRPAMYDAFHKPILIKTGIEEQTEEKESGRHDDENRKEKVKNIYDIVGPICESSDVFCHNVEISQDVKAGDGIAFLNAGAYGKSMASNYNLHDIAGELLIDGDKVIEIAKPISWKDLTKFEGH